MNINTWQTHRNVHQKSNGIEKFKETKFNFNKFLVYYYQWIFDSIQTKGHIVNFKGIHIEYYNIHIKHSIYLVYIINVKETHETTNAY